MEVFDYEAKFSEEEKARRMAELRYQFLIERCDNFPRESIRDIKREIEPLDDTELEELILTDYKKVNKALFLSAFLGMFGLDRLYIGDKKLGIVKLLTLGGLGIWWIVDFFHIAERTKEKNLETYRAKVKTMLEHDKKIEWLLS